MAQVEAVLKEELKIDRLDEVFKEFEETPVGAGRFISGYTTGPLHSALFE